MAGLLLLMQAGPVGAQSSATNRAASLATPTAAVVLSAVADRDAEGNVVLRAFRVAEGVVLDGRLDEPIYTEVEPAADFIQQEPNEGALATERTEAWVFYDDDDLYVAARLWDSQPARMVANELRRDHQNIFQNESFAVLLDTFHDRRNGFFFQTNALGALRDGLITDERSANFDWNTVWDVKTSEFDGGWTLEMAIPFKSLRFRGRGDQVWGINLHRFVHPAREPTTVRSFKTKSWDNPGCATLPKLSDPKLLPKVALKILLSASLSKLPPRFSAAAPVNTPAAESTLIEVSSVPEGASTDSSPDATS